MIDLEDSVAEGAKDQARDAVAEAIRDGDWGARNVAVRINACDSPPLLPRRGRARLRRGRRAGGPRGAEGRERRRRGVRRTGSPRWSGRSAAAARPLGLQALVETAAGLRRIDELARASVRLEALIVGYADLAASLGRPLRPVPGPDERWHWVLETVLVAARAAGLQAIDGPWLDIADDEGFLASAERLRRSATTASGRCTPARSSRSTIASHPRGRSSTTRQRCSRRSRTRRPPAAARLLHEGAMIDEASRKHALRTVARGTAAGLG